MAEGGGVRTARSKPAKLTMEEYLGFLHSNKQTDLLVDHLNQIIDMHGFKKLRRSTKSVLMEVVNSVELTDPKRSTLGNDGASRQGAFLTMDDVINDLSELKWQECCVTSVQSIPAAVEYSGQQQNLNNAASAVTVASPALPKRRRKRLIKVVQSGGGNESASATSFGGPETASCSSSVVMKLAPRKKRGVNYINGSAADAAGKLQPLSSSSSSTFLRLTSH